MHGLYEPEDTNSREMLDALDDPDVKTALLNRIGDWQNANGERHYFVSTRQIRLYVRR